MVNHAKLMAVLLAATCLTSSLAFAGDNGATSGGVPGASSHENDIELGVLGLGGTNPDQAGRYNGLTTRGVDVLGRFDFERRPAGDSTWYYDFSGRNLVFQTGSYLGSAIGSDGNYRSRTANNLANIGSIDLGFGRQGSWESSLGFNSISYTGNVVDSLYSYSGDPLATLNSGLTPWAGATASTRGSLTKSTLTIPVLSATGAMQPFQAGTRRDIGSGNFKYIYGHWTVDGAVRYEHKYGSLEDSFDGPWGGTAFALPIDYDTGRYDLTAEYATRRDQILLQETYSRFEDANTYINLPYPYSNTAAPYQLSAAYSTPPSNQADYLTLEAASNRIPKTRVNLNARVGLETQDNGFPPNTADPDPSPLNGYSNLNPVTLQGTTAGSPDIRAKVYQGTVSATSSPVANSSLRAFYGIDGRNVTLNQYLVYTGGQTSDARLTGSGYVIPQNWVKQNAGLNFGYLLIPRYSTRLTLGYRYDHTSRSNAQVGQSSKDTMRIAVTSSMGSKSFARLSFVHADRTGVVVYLLPWYNLEQGAVPSPVPACASADLSECSAATFEAPMNSNSVKLMVDYMPHEDLTANLLFMYERHSYTYAAAETLTGTGEGLRSDYDLSAGPDVTYRPRQGMSYHLYYTFQRIFYETRGNGACAQSNTGDCAGSIGFFQDRYTSDMQTMGFDGKWQVTEKLKVAAHYTFAYGSVLFGLYNGVFVNTPKPGAFYQNVADFPQIISKMHDARLTAKYAMRANVDLMFGLGWEYYRDDNFNDTAAAIQGAGSTAVNFLTPGYGSPYYSVGYVMVGGRVKF